MLKERTHDKWEALIQQKNNHIKALEEDAREARSETNNIKWKIDQLEKELKELRHLPKVIEELRKILIEVKVRECQPRQVLMFIGQMDGLWQEKKLFFGLQVKEQS